MENDAKLLVDYMQYGTRLKRDLDNKTFWLIQKAKDRLCVSVRDNIAGHVTEFVLDSNGFILDATYRELGNDHEAPLKLGDAYRALYTQVLEHPVFSELKIQQKQRSDAHIQADKQAKAERIALNNSKLLAVRPPSDSNQDPSQEIAA